MADAITIQIDVKFCTFEPDGEKCISCDDVIWIKGWEPRLFNPAGNEVFTIENCKICDSCHDKMQFTC